MRKDIRDALLSVGEVALFSWSLLELLLTRILPLAGYLAGHLLLQFCRLLASSIVIAAAGWPEPRQSEYSCDVQAEELSEEDNVQVVKEEGDRENDLESLKSSDERLEERQILTSSTNDEDVDGQAAAMPGATDATATITLDAVHVPESVPSDGQIIEILRASDEVQARGSDNGHVAETERLDLGSNVADVVGEEQRHVSASSEGSSSTEGDEMRKSRRRMRVLPPSLSQIKRTLMQRSRRASASPSPAGSTPSPLKKKSPRRRMLASSAVKSSSSYDNFMSKFRKHFLLDPA